MRPAVVEKLVEKVRVGPDFCLQAQLSSDMGDVFRNQRALAPPPAEVTPLLPFNQAQYEGQGLICLTYDDGLLDNFTLAAPLHLRHRIPANFAVIAKCLLRPPSHTGFMSPLMCRMLIDLGFEISSHGMLHCKRLRDMTLKELHQDVHLSKQVIESAVGVPGAISTYCIPFSRARALHIDYLNSVYAVLRQAGSVMNDVPLRSQRCLSSFPVTNATTFDSIKVLIDDAVENRRALVLMLHGICPDDARPAVFEIRAGLLDRILSYVAQQGIERLLPMRLSSFQHITRSVVDAARRGDGQNTTPHGPHQPWPSATTPPPTG